MGSLGVGHDWVTSLSLFTFMHWRRKWQPTPLFLPGESQGQGSLVGCHLWGRRVEHDWSDSSSSSCVTLGKTLRLSELYCPQYLSGLFWKFIKWPITQITHLAFNACMVFFLLLSTIWLIIKHLEPIKILKVQCWNELIFLGFKCRISLVFKQ